MIFEYHYEYHKLDISNVQILELFNRWWIQNGIISINSDTMFYLSSISMYHGIVLTPGFSMAIIVLTDDLKYFEYVISFNATYFIRNTVSIP